MGKEEKAAAGEKKVVPEGKEEEGKKQQEVAEKKAEGGAEGEKKGDENKDAEGNKDREADGKAAEGGGEGEGEKKTPPPPPPEEIVMRVYMHCEGCARKVQRSLAGFPGVEEVKADCRTHMVVVKGKAAAADPLRVVERLQRKSGRKAELLSPIPPKPEEEVEKKEEKEKPKPKEEKKEEPPVIAAVLKVRMHCDACSLEMKKRILKMKGVQSADPDLRASQVTVTGVFDPAALAEHVYRRTGRHAVIVKTELVGEKASGEGDEDKAGGDAGAVKAAGGGGEGGEKAKEGGGDGGGAASDGGAAGKGGEVTKNPYHSYYYPRYQVAYAYPPQIFSDENPNACSAM